MKRRRRKHTRALWLLLLITPLVFAATFQMAKPSGVITFSGKVVSLDNNEPPTVILTETKDNQTVYVVKSVITGRELAKFSTKQDAEIYSKQLLQSKAYLSQ